MEQPENSNNYVSIVLNWPQARAVGQTKVFLHWPMEFCYLHYGCGEKTWKQIMEDFKQNASSCLETMPWFSYSKAIKKILGFLEYFLTPDYIFPWHRILTVMLKDLGFRCVLTKERERERITIERVWDASQAQMNKQIRKSSEQKRSHCHQHLSC